MTKASAHYFGTAPLRPGLCLISDRDTQRLLDDHRPRRANEIALRASVGLIWLICTSCVTPAPDRGL